MRQFTEFFCFFKLLMLVTARNSKNINHFKKTGDVGVNPDDLPAGKHFPLGPKAPGVTLNEMWTRTRFPTSIYLVDCPECMEILMDLCYLAHPEKKQTKFTINDLIYDPESCDEATISRQTTSEYNITCCRYPVSISMQTSIQPKQSVGQGPFFAYYTSSFRVANFVQEKAKVVILGYVFVAPPVDLLVPVEPRNESVWMVIAPWVEADETADDSHDNEALVVYGYQPFRLKDNQIDMCEYELWAGGVPMNRENEVKNLLLKTKPGQDLPIQMLTTTTIGLWVPAKCTPTIEILPPTNYSLDKNQRAHCDDGRFFVQGPGYGEPQTRYHGGILFQYSWFCIENALDVDLELVDIEKGQLQIAFGDQEGNSENLDPLDNTSQPHTITRKAVWRVSFTWTNADPIPTYYETTGFLVRLYVKVAIDPTTTVPDGEATRIITEPASGSDLTTKSSTSHKIFFAFVRLFLITYCVLY